MKVKHIFSLSLLLLFSSLGGLRAQEDLDKLLESGIEDAKKLTRGYISPLMQGIGTGLSGGWYNTAKAHKSAGFDITVTANAAFVPNEELFYDIGGLNLETVGLDPSHENFNSFSDNRVPTLFGPRLAPGYEIVQGPAAGETFEGPEGVDIEGEIGSNVVPVPMAQLGIGIIKNTDIKIRWTPKLDIDDGGSFKLIGFGVMHDIKQHIPGMKQLPFDLSAFVGFTDISMELDFSDENDPATKGQKGAIDANVWTFQGIISKKFSVITLYGGLGVTTMKSSIALEGNYDINDDGDFNDANEVNPFSLEFTEGGGPRLTAGFRLKLAILTIHADYTVQKYDVLTAGVGFSIR